MPIIQNPTIGRKLQRALRLTELPDSILAPEVVATISVEDLTAPLSDIERGCAGSLDIGGVVAEFPLFGLVLVGNPPSYDLKVTALTISVSSDTILRVARARQAILGLTATTDTGFTNFGIPGRPASQLGSDTVAVLPTMDQLFRFRVLASTPVRVPLDFRLGGPDPVTNFSNVLLVIAGATNIIMTGSFEWTESELLG